MTDADQSGGQSDQSGNPAWNPGSLLVKTTQVEGQVHLSLAEVGVLIVLIFLVVTIVVLL